MEEKEIRYSEDGKSMLIIGKPLQAPEPTPQRKSENDERVDVVNILSICKEGFIEKS